MRSIVVIAMLITIAPAVVHSQIIGKRPTSDEVTKAVEASSAEYAKRNPPPSQQQVIKRLDNEIKDLLRDKLSARGNNEKLKEIDAAISATRKLRERAKKGDLPPVPKKLTPLDFKTLETGSVGSINRETGNSFTNLKCQQILNESRALVIVHRSVSSPPQPGDGMRPRVSDSYTTIILEGIDTGKVVEGKAIRLGELQGVITGRERFESTDGGTMTVPIVEIFDPEKPFQ